MSAGACLPEGPATLDRELLCPGTASSQKRPWTLTVLVANHPARLGMGLGAKKAWKEK